MMNSFFEYRDFAPVEKLNIDITATGVDLQTGASTEHLKRELLPYDYASFEKDAYITSNPKFFAPKTKKLGILSKSVSNENGSMGRVVITITLPDPILLSGITLWCLNKLKSIQIVYNDIQGEVVRDETFNAIYITEKKQFFNMVGEGVKTVKLVYPSLVDPYHFLGIYRIDFGDVRVFDKTNLVDAKTRTYYSLDGTTIEYDVLEAEVFHENDVEYGFSKNQVITHKDENGEIINRFYVENGTQSTDNVVEFKAYDSVSLLEGKFLGGMYGFENIYTGENGTPYPYNQLIADIFKDTEVDYRTEGTDDIEVTGYIPICTRRKALALLGYGTNTRCVKEGGVLVFKPLSMGNNVSYDNSVIIENPKIKTTEKIGKLVAIKHNYKKSNEEVELYNWYLQQGENTMQLIEFSEPVWKIDAFEVVVTETDENGFEITEERPIVDQITFYHAPLGGGQAEGDEYACNYCIIKSNSISNKVLIKGWKISDGHNKVEINNPTTSVNVDFDEIELDDITITNDIEAVAKVQFAIANQRKKQTFEVVEVDRPLIGDNINTSLVQSPVTIKSDKGDIILDMKITSVTDDLSGVYKVVAE